MNLRSRVLFGDTLTYERLRSMWEQGGLFKMVTIEDPDEDIPSLETASDGIPLFWVTPEKILHAVTVDQQKRPSRGDQLVYLEAP